MKTKITFPIAQGCQHGRVSVRHKAVNYSFASAIFRFGLITDLLVSISLSLNLGLFIEIFWYFAMPIRCPIHIGGLEVDVNNNAMPFLCPTVLAIIR